MRRPSDTHLHHATMADPLIVKLVGDKVIIDGHLKISCRRTIRVPDNGQQSFLPPDLGSFPLKPVSVYHGNLASSIAAKGGVFLPMWRMSNSHSEGI